MAAIKGSIVPSLQNTRPEPLARSALVLETERLRMRPLNGDDMDLGKAVYLDPEVMKYAGPMSTPEKLADDLATAMGRGAGGRLGVWCVMDKESGEKLGTAILLPLPLEGEDTDWSEVVEDRYPDADIEVGYMFKRSAWRRGYATETCRRLVRFAFEQAGLDEVVAVTDPDNHASQNVLLKAGLRDRGLVHAYSHKVPGFGITREEWLGDLAKSC